jgi:succinate dehydrogenase/fumarate reductase flavoprotein subunit
MVFGECAGRFAAEAAGSDPGWLPAYADRSRSELADLRARKGTGRVPGIAQAELQDVMWEHAGPFRSGDGLERALARIRALRRELPKLAIADGEVFNLDLQDWFELRAMLVSAEAVVASAIQRAESRGAHQRLDATQMIPGLEKNQLVSLEGGAMQSRWSAVVRSGVRTA